METEQCAGIGSRGLSVEMKRTADGQSRGCRSYSSEWTLRAKRFGRVGQRGPRRTVGRRAHKTTKPLEPARKVMPPPSAHSTPRAPRTPLCVPGRCACCRPRIQLQQGDRPMRSGMFDLAPFRAGRAPLLMRCERDSHGDGGRGGRGARSGTDDGGGDGDGSSTGNGKGSCPQCYKNPPSTTLLCGPTQHARRGGATTGSVRESRQCLSSTAGSAGGHRCGRARRQRNRGKEVGKPEQRRAALETNRDARQIEGVVSEAACNAWGEKLKLDVFRGG